MASQTRAAARTTPSRRNGRDALTIARRRQGRGFSYHRNDGRRIRDSEVLRRLASLAVPPAYVDVAYSGDPSARLQAMGRDSAGRWQYRYHADWEKVRERRKARHLVRLIAALPRIRRHVTTVLSSRQPTREFAMAAAIALIDATGIRSGTSRHMRLSGARGAVTLLKSNVRINGCSIALAFQAKGGKRVEKDVDAPRLVPALKVLQRLPGRRLFQHQDGDAIRTIRVRDVNAFLCEVACCKVSLKDFRTLRASLHVLRQLTRMERGESQRRRKLQVKQAINGAAEELANTAAVCRRSYVHDAIIDAFEQGSLATARTPKQAPRSIRQLLTEVVSPQG